MLYGVGRLGRVMTSDEKYVCRETWDEIFNIIS